MKSRTIAYYIALALWKKYARDEKEPKNITYVEIDAEIRMIAGEAPQTINKYRAILERDNFIVATSSTTFEVQKEPKRPLSQKEYVDSLRKM